MLREGRVRAVLDAVHDQGMANYPLASGEVLAMLAQLVACDTVTLLRFDGPGVLTGHVEYPQLDLPDDHAYIDGFRAHLDDCGFCRAPQRFADRYGVSALVDAVGSPDRHVTGRRAEAFRDVANNYALVTPLGGDDARLVFCRADRAFRPPEKWALGLIAPHLDHAYRQAAHRRAAVRLTTRQREVLREVSLGHSDAQIAARLYLAPGTVRRHLDDIFARLGVTSRTAAVARVHAAGSTPDDLFA